MKRIDLIPGKKYRFLRAAHDDYETYSFVRGDDTKATFEIWEHDPSDGREEYKGDIEFDAYQISQLIMSEVKEEEETE